jgi:hypothetical protein
MSKPNTIDANYLGACICLNPSGMLYVLVDIISLSFTHLTFQQLGTWKHRAFIAKDSPYLCSTFWVRMTFTEAQNPHVWSSGFR